MAATDQGSGSEAQEHPCPRAYSALCFDEEKHLVLGHAFGVMLMGTDLQILRESGEYEPRGLLMASAAYAAARQEFEGILRKTASDDVISDKKVQEAATAAIERPINKETLQLEKGPGGGKKDPILGGTSFTDPVFEKEKIALLHKCYLWTAAMFHARELRSRTPTEEATRTYQELQAQLMATKARVRADKSTMLVLVGAIGAQLAGCSRQLQDDADVVLEAIRADVHAFRFASDRLRCDKDFAFQALKVSPGSLEHMGPHLQRDEEVVIAAVKSQDKQYIQQQPLNILNFAANMMRSNEEVVLAAISMDGRSMREADATLRQDKDFLLRAARVAPPGDIEMCYKLAKPTGTVTFSDVLGASQSALAAPGDNDPVLTVKLVSDPKSSDSDKAGEIMPFEVSLLSGASFTVSLPATSSIIKRRSKASPPILAEFAQLLVDELPKHMEAKSVSKRVFIVFSNDQDSGAAPVSVTPWDWDRPVTDFTS